MEKGTTKNLCNSCLQLVDDGCTTCPHCGFEIDTKKPLELSESKQGEIEDALWIRGIILWRIIPILIISAILLLMLIIGIYRPF